ncbi:MAG: hypothetical protein R3E12_15130 [Candidatus Eisenbacteria bacterium]|uniref:Uncharacterized protein n=1 Tax=Eiseniibacteriota bacterium TaxID=2212470 RepID=A0A956LZB3_UNCEI|nr:hypothetical protein [Candidatus Eisenbacteria bacterium]
MESSRTATGQPQVRRSFSFRTSLLTVLIAFGLLRTGSASTGEDPLCILGPEGGPPRSVDDDLDLEAVHCTCPESVAFFSNADRGYEVALMWNGPGLAGPHYGAFAERYETPHNQAGAVCQLILRVTDNGNAIRSMVDLYVWRDADGVPGEITGIVPGYDLGPLPPWPNVPTRTAEVYELQQIGVQGPFWVGFRGAWEADSCSVYLAADVSGDRPETVRRGMTYVAPGMAYPEGWHTIEEIYGQPAALGIGVIVGWCPVPTKETSWGRVKMLYR